MPHASASRLLLAPREDVWALISDPQRFADWWPGVVAVEPGRGVLAEGARWDVRGHDRPALFRRTTSSGKLLVRGVQRPGRFAWTLTSDHLHAELRLEEKGPDRTVATLVVEAPWLIGLGSALPRRALTRLHALCQTPAGF
jgi:uncharacterized protein YndB with AHSA1/START domain